MPKHKRLMKKLFTPATIMLIPHSNRKPLNLKISYMGILISLMMCFIGTAYVFSIAVDAIQYNLMEKRLKYYAGQFVEIKSTMDALKKADAEFRKLFSLKSKEKVLEKMETSDYGAIDMETLKQEIRKSIETVSDIRDYMSQQRDLYKATPKGWPIMGRLTSPYGMRDHPTSGEMSFHTGIDIATNPGNPVTSTADGIVSFSGWNGGSGNLVVVEHGFGYSTFYAHNKMNAVEVGQRVKKGAIIAYVGSTGNTTGPHLHYEVWQNGSSVNPMTYVERRN